MTPQKSLNTTLHIKLLSLAQTASGFSASEVTGYSAEQVRRAAEALVEARQIVRTAVTPRRVRYFTDEKLVSAYMADRAKSARSLTTIGPRTKAPWSVDEPGLITARTKIYRAPPPPANVFRTNTFSQF